MMGIYLLMTQDIRWHQRFSSYNKALQRLNKAIEIIEKELAKQTEDVDDLLKEGLIQRFEYSYELAWKVMKDYAEYQGIVDLKGPRDATREAFKMNLITDAVGWMDMLQSRNLISHTYDEETYEELYSNIIDNYQGLLNAFEKKMIGLINN